MRSAQLLSLAATALAQSATIVIEASHGGAGNGLTNTTITVPLSTTFTDPALDTVSTLFLTGASGVPVESLTCTPYRYANGTGTGGLPFNSTNPSLLSTNAVQVGSIICTSSATAGNTSASGTGEASTPITTSVMPYANSTSSMTTSDIVSTVTNPTSTFVTTVPAATSGSVAPQSKITSVVVGGSGSSMTTAGSGTVSGSSTTASASPSVGTNAGVRIALGDWVMQGVAVAGLGVAAIV